MYPDECVGVCLACEEREDEGVVRCHCDGEDKETRSDGCAQCEVFLKTSMVPFIAR